MKVYLLFIQFKNVLKRIQYVKNWYSFYLVYFGIAKKSFIKFKNGFNCEISINDIASFYFIEQLITDYRVSKTVFSKNKNALELLGKSDFIFEYKGYKWYIKRGYELDVAHEIFQQFTEPETYKIFQKLHGKLFINIGANAGGYTIPGSKNFDKVIALEPNPKIFYALNKNIKLNKLKNVESFQFAAWSKETKLKLFEPDTKLGYGGGVSTLLPKSMSNEGINYNSNFYVNTKTINNMFRNKNVIDLLLIDAENAELEILKGSNEVLNKVKFIIVEVRNNTEKGVKEILNKNNFKIKELDVSQNSKNIFGKKI